MAEFHEVISPDRLDIPLPDGAVTSERLTLYDRQQNDVDSSDPTFSHDFCLEDEITRVGHLRFLVTMYRVRENGTRFAHLETFTFRPVVAIAEEPTRLTTFAAPWPSIPIEELKDMTTVGTGRNLTWWSFSS